METDLYQEYLKFKIQPELQVDLEKIYNIACKSESTTVQCINMKQMEWVQLIMEKGLIKNNFSAKFFVDNYEIALKEDIQEPKKEEKDGKKKQNESKFEAEKKKKEEEKAKENMRDKFHRWRFFYLIWLIAKKMFKGHKKPFEEFLNVLQKDVNSAIMRRKMYDGLIPVIRQMKVDDTVNRLISQQALKAFDEFQRDLQLVFSIYISENYEYITKYGTPMLTWEEIAMLNKSMSTPAFIRFLHESRILPKFVSIESVQESLLRFIPAVTIKENGFYGSNKPIEIYEADILKNSVFKEYDGDPQISMFEFQMILGKIALDTCSAKEQDKKIIIKDDYTPIQTFLSKVLHIRPDSDQEIDHLLQNDSPFCNLLVQQIKDRIIKSSQSKEDNKDDYLQVSPQELLTRELEEQKFRSEDKANMNYKQVFTQLNDELPPLPPKYQVKQENPPKQYDNPEDEIPWKDRIKDFILIGEQPPKPPPEKNMGNKNKDIKSKKINQVADQFDRQILWEDRSKPVPKSSLDHLRDYNNQIEFNETDLNDITRGTMSQIQVLPVLIDELIYPTNCPAQCQKYLEASFLSFHEKDYTMAYKNMELCYELWSTKEEETLIPENILFFEVYKGMIYQSTGRDDMAIKYYLYSKTLGDKLPFSPDKAIPYACLGNILYRMYEYEMACRCFLKARDCRELTIGADTVEVATIFNNLGCCMALMERNKEAQTYYQFSHAIFDLEIGPIHTRTLTVLRNLQKLKYAYMDYTPAYKRLWYSYEKDPFGNTKVAKATKKKQ